MNGMFDMISRHFRGSTHFTQVHQSSCWPVSLISVLIPRGRVRNVVVGLVVVVCRASILL